MSKKQTLVAGILLLIMAMVITACSGSTDESAADSGMGNAAMGEGGMDESADDHDEDGGADGDGSADHAAQPHVETPDEYADMANPFDGDANAIDAGEVTYSTLCATCHGAEGNGDGVAAAGLDPSPAQLSNGMMMDGLSDGYLFWRVSEGGAMEPFNSAMPSWVSLPEDQRWEVISYIRTLSE